MRHNEPYILINATLAAILFLIFSYSFSYPYLVSQGWTVPSSCEGMPEIYCRSRGLTRAFSQIMRLNFDLAASLNKYAISIFLFFIVQFLTRIIFSILYLKTKNGKLMVIDSICSGAYFIYTFFPLTYFYYWIWEIQ